MAGARGGARGRAGPPPAAARSARDRSGARVDRAARRARAAGARAGPDGERPHRDHRAAATGGDDRARAAGRDDRAGANRAPTRARAGARARARSPMAVSTAPPADKDQGTEMLSRPGAATVADPRPGREPAEAVVVAPARPPPRAADLAALAGAGPDPDAGVLGVLAASSGEDPTTTGSTPPPTRSRSEANRLGDRAGRVARGRRPGDPQARVRQREPAAPRRRRGHQHLGRHDHRHGPALLPPLFTKFSTTAGQASPSASARSRHTVTPSAAQGLDEELTLYVAPTNRGVANVACVSEAVPATARRARRPSSSPTASRSPARTDPAYARAVDGALGRARAPAQCRHGPAPQRQAARQRPTQPPTSPPPTATRARH